MIWTENNIQRIVLDMASQIQRTPTSALSALPARTVDLAHDLGMNSLSRMALAAQVNEFFGLFQTSVANYLLTDSRLDHWTKKILRARRENDQDVVFLTSGTSGNPQRIRHALAALLHEADVLQQLIPRPAQVISTVPSHHIYGFLYTVVLPALWEVPVRSLSAVNGATLTSDSLLIGTPSTWEYLHRTLVGSGQMDCCGVCSTAPLSSSLFSRLITGGINLLDVYGSTDTGGIAFRRLPDAAFHLLPHVRLIGDPPSHVAIGEHGVPFPLPDQIEPVSDREIRVLKRHDGAVQIGGVNVSPAYIQTIVSNCPLVAECDLYAKAVDGHCQLFCSIRLRHHTVQTEQACRDWLRANLNEREVPPRIQFY